MSVIKELGTCSILKDIHSDYIRYLIASINLVLMLISTVGNSLIIVSVLKSSYLRSLAPTYFIISLASADWLVGAVVQPLYVIILFDWSSGTCVIEPYKLGLGFFTCSVSICSAIMVCLDRMWMICEPFKYNTYITSKRVFIAIVFIWLSGAMIGYGSVFMPERKLIAFGTLLWVLTALGIGVYCSVKIYKVGVRQIKEIFKNSIGGESAVQAKKCILRERKLAASLIMVLAGILLCWIPFVIGNICIQFMYTLQNWKIFYLVRTSTITIGYANSCLNIFIFSFKNREIKIAIRNLLGIKKSKILPEMLRDIFKQEYGSTGISARTTPECDDNT